MKKHSLVAALTAMALSVALSGCVSTNVAVQKPNDADFASAKKIAVLKVKFSERVLPVLPLLDAGIYAAAANAVKPKLLEVEAAGAAEMSEGLAREVMNITQKDVAMAKSPADVIAYGAFDANVATKLIQDVAAANQADYVIAIVARVETVAVAAFGINGRHQEESTMYIFDAQGTLHGKANFVSDSITATAQDLVGYRQVVDSWKVYGIQMVDLLLKGKAAAK